MQLGLARHRRPELGAQWFMLVSGALSALAGLVLVAGAGASDPKLTYLIFYALLGGALFIVSALTITRRSRQAVLAAAVSETPAA